MLSSETRGSATGSDRAAGHIKSFRWWVMGVNSKRIAKMRRVD